ncbi:MAG: hypothetical protein JF609_03730 [Verrucomicrobia bacterium]|nr:hypothetical protein [Verrucomicrobiota bacterium]
MINVYITGQSGSEMTHIINGTGSTLNTGVTTTTANNLWSNLAFGVSAGLDATRTNLNITLPTESWHVYKLQYKNQVTDSTWLDTGNPFGGNDTLETVTDPTKLSSRFYRIIAW